MKKIRSEIVINARPEEVWAILIDFGAYPDWNPFIRSISGEARTGSCLEVHIQPPGWREMILRPKVLRAVQSHELRWIGRLLVAGLFDGEHRFTLEPQGEEKVRFIQAELFSGLLVPIFSRVIADTKWGFVAMNQALKERAEAGSPGREIGRNLQETATLMSAGFIPVRTHFWLSCSSPCSSTMQPSSIATSPPNPGSRSISRKAKNGCSSMRATPELSSRTPGRWGSISSGSTTSSSRTVTSTIRGDSTHLSGCIPRRRSRGEYTESRRSSPTPMPS